MIKSHPLRKLNFQMSVVEDIVTTNEGKFVAYLNNAQTILLQESMHLELIPGIGKTYMKTMLEEREKTKIRKLSRLARTCWIQRTHQAYLLSELLDEITGESRMNLFVKR